MIKKFKYKKKHKILISINEQKKKSLYTNYI